MAGIGYAGTDTEDEGDMSCWKAREEGKEEHDHHLLKLSEWKNYGTMNINPSLGEKLS